MQESKTIIVTAIPVRAVPGGVIAEFGLVMGVLGSSAPFARGAFVWLVPPVFHHLMLCFYRLRNLTALTVWLGYICHTEPPNVLRDVCVVSVRNACHTGFSNGTKIGCIPIHWINISYCFDQKEEKLIISRGQPHPKYKANSARTSHIAIWERDPQSLGVTGDELHDGAE